MLNPHQFEQHKVDLGSTELNARAERSEQAIASRKSETGGDTADAPAGYYSQPSSHIRQQALPGMEMSVQDHLDALGKATGMRASIDSGRVSHRIALHGEREDTSSPWGGTTSVEKAHLSYSNERPERGVKDNGDVVGVGHVEAKHPGEIRMVRSHVPNGAGLMLETAERLAAEHGMAYPKHSWDRTKQGVQWSQKQMRKRGEQVW